MKFGLFLVFLVISNMLIPVRAEGVPWSRIIGCPEDKLSSKDRSRAEKLMKSINNYYGCSDKVASCLKKDKKNETARRLAGMICRMVRHGRSDAVIRKEAMYRARSMHPFKKHKIKHHRNHCTMDPKKAKVVVTAFTDFSCPYCRIIVPYLKKKALGSKGEVALCFKHFPTQTHGKDAVIAAQAAVAASKQGKFWPYFDILYATKDHSSGQLEKYAKQLGLDLSKFNEDRKSRSVRRFVAIDKREGLKMKVKGTPTLFLNGKKYLGRKDKAELRDRIAEELHLVSGGR